MDEQNKEFLSDNNLIQKNSDFSQVQTDNFAQNSDGKIADYNFSADPYYALPQNYTNKYNLSRGDFAPLTIKAALNRCLQDRGAVDIEYISMLTMLSLKDTVFALENFVFRDPEKAGEYFYTGYVTAEEYLSGDLFKKLTKASEANAKSGRYEKNIKALKAVLPAKPKFDEIFVTLGSPFLPASFVTDFVQYLYRLSLIRNKRVCEVCYQKEIHDWSVILNVDVKNTVIACKTFGTERIDMFKIIEKTLNHEQIRITDVHETSKTARKFNREQTMIAEEKRTKLIDCFNHWLNDLPDDKKQEIVDSYYEKYYCYRPRRFDGKNIELHDLNENIKLYDYQKDAAWRIMLSPATLLAHDVGAGKTYAMVVAAHEMKKSGISKKNLIVVPNSIVAQWADDYKLLYPSAEILTVTPQNFAPAVRERTLNLIKDGDYDAIIMPYSSFEMIPVSGKNNAIELKLALTRMENAMAENMRRRPNVKNRLNTLLSKAHDKMQVKYNDAIKRIIDYSEQITFEELGITALFIDEAHNYKNLPLVSSMGSIKGVNVDGSDKCEDIYLKTSTVLKNGGKLIFATGTPVTNSVADVYVMQKYLDEELLTEIDLDYFDNWAGMFGEITRSYEIDVDTENYRLATRFNRFNNLGILSRLINGFTDFHVVGVEGLPEIAEIKTVVVQKTPIQAELLKDISVRVEKIRSGEVERKEDNLLKVTTDGRKLALDVRLLALQRQILCSKGSENEIWNSKLYGNKISVCAENVFDFYNRFKGKTQLVFCDIGTPKSEFNVYDCLKNELCRLGIKEEEIGFVHDATSEARRARLFESVNSGEIKVLIGSTFKLGTGVNVQEKLIAIHHLDVPWRPSDMVQRDGRLVRRGNTNEKVYIFRYVTDGSFDAYSWQILENKQRFITELLSGSAKGADERRLDDAVLSYAEVKALAIGNPLIKTRVEICNELARLKTLEREENLKREDLENMKLALPEEIEREKQRLLCVKADAVDYKYSSETPDNRLIARLISKTISENALNAQEIFIADFKNFKIVLPANFNKIRPYLILQAKARYVLDIATFSSGAVTKIENFLSTLDKQAKELTERINELEMQFIQVKHELEKGDEYACKIAELTEKLNETDKTLGLEKTPVV